jgi:hypothetical protein
MVSLEYLCHRSNLTTEGNFVIFLTKLAMLSIFSLMRNPLLPINRYRVYPIDDAFVKGGRGLCAFFHGWIGANEGYA